MEYSGLQELIEGLEYGTKLHISVVFFGNYGNQKTRLNQKNTFHASPLCDAAKSISGGFAKCFKCRNTAIKKAFKKHTDFSGLCINGVFEYCRPVMDSDNVICIIFIGNILTDNTRISKILQKNKFLAETMEKNFSHADCSRLCDIVESYIRILLSEYSQNNSDIVYNPLIENLKSFIDMNFAYDINLEQLSHTFHYNEKYLGRLFKKETGISYNQYINKKRIEFAAGMLKSSHDTVINISFKAGFNNVTYFNRMFKKYYNTTPLEYRKKYGECEKKSVNMIPSMIEYK